MALAIAYGLQSSYWNELGTLILLAPIAFGCGMIAFGSTLLVWLRRSRPQGRRADAVFVYIGCSAAGGVVLWFIGVLASLK